MTGESLLQSYVPEVAMQPLWDACRLTAVRQLSEEVQPFLLTTVVVRYLNASRHSGDGSACFEAHRVRWLRREPLAGLTMPLSGSLPTLLA